MSTVLGKEEGVSAESAVSDNQFGAFAGVFAPTILTILGAIMYLRLGWVVGNAGLIGALAIILLAHLITICTGLSVSSIATNTRVGAGGAFAIISQTLGLEIGGSVGVPLYLAQGISVALYCLAFGEGWERTFNHDPRLVAIITYFVVFLVAYISAQFASRIQFVIMALIVISLISIVLGSFPIAGQVGLAETPQLWGDFSAGGFWATFAIFFPAVTGIMSGISMSGTLREPRKAIPQGTMGAIFVGLVIYVLLAFWLAMIATTDDLLSNNTIMVDKAFWDWAILAGILGATFSSALGSLVAAPRVMQALAKKGLLPKSAYFSQQTASGEPRQATITTGIIGFIALLVAIASGGLDAVAGVLTMVFLIAYAMLNVVVLFEQTLGMVSFRPMLSVPRIVPLFGMVGCLFVMFLVNPTFSLIAIAAVLGLYFVLARTSFDAHEKDLRSGLFNQIAEWAVVRSSRMPPAVERTWKPAILCPVDDDAAFAGSYRFLRAVTAPQGMVNALGVYKSGEQAKVSGLEELTNAIADDGIHASATFLEAEDFTDGVRAATQILKRSFFRPNILFLRMDKDSNLELLQELVQKTAAYRMGICLLARHPVKDMGREKSLNVWISRPSSEAWVPDFRTGNQDLALLLAIKLQANWQGKINICMAVRNEAEAALAVTYLQEVSMLVRLPKSTTTDIVIAPFTDALTQVDKADLSVLGLSPNADLEFSQKIAGIVDGSCVFVRDSGDESALA